MGKGASKAPALSPFTSSKHIAATFRIQEQYLHEIEKGRKTVEARLKRGNAFRLQTGDRVCLTTGERLKTTVITRVRRFTTFRDMLERCGLRHCLPGCKSLKDGVNLYHSFSDYAAVVKTHGVLAFDIQLVIDHGTPAPAATDPKANVSNAVASSSSSSTVAPSRTDGQVPANVSTARASSSSSSSAVAPSRGDGQVPANVSTAVASFSSSSSAVAPGRGDGQVQCTRCDQVGHSSENCPLFSGPAVDHPDARARGGGVHMRGNIGRINYERIVNGTTRGEASGHDCNCLIYTLKQLISPNSNVDDVRKALRVRFRRKGSADQVTAQNYLDFGSHWRDIVQLFGKDADNYNITCIDLQHEQIGEVVWNLHDMDGVHHLYVARVNANHFILLHKKSFGQIL